MAKKKKYVNSSPYPDDAIERLARCFYPSMLEFFHSEEGQREFAAWQAEQEALAQKKSKGTPSRKKAA